MPNVTANLIHTQPWTPPSVPPGDSVILYIEDLAIDEAGTPLPAGTPLLAGFTGMNNQRPDLSANAIGGGTVQVILRNHDGGGYLNLQPGTLTLIAFVAEAGQPGGPIGGGGEDQVGV